FVHPTRKHALVVVVHEERRKVRVPERERDRYLRDRVESQVVAVDEVGRGHTLVRFPGGRNSIEYRGIGAPNALSAGEDALNPQQVKRQWSRGLVRVVVDVCGLGDRLQLVADGLNRPVNVTVKFAVAEA